MKPYKYNYKFHAFLHTGTGKVIALLLCCAIIIGICSFVLSDYVRDTAEPVLSKIGSRGDEVRRIQTKLKNLGFFNGAVDGIYGSRTESSIKAFQRIFGLIPDGIVGPATWYEIVRLYTAVTRLAELRSQGQQFYANSWSAPNSLQVGDTGDYVRFLQYMQKTGEVKIAKDNLHFPGKD